jgi:hypothetical protein
LAFLVIWIGIYPSTIISLFTLSLDSLTLRGLL